MMTPKEQKAFLDAYPINTCTVIEKEPFMKDVKIIICKPDDVVLVNGKLLRNPNND